MLEVPVIETDDASSYSAQQGDSHKKHFKWNTE